MKRRSALPLSLVLALFCGMAGHAQTPTVKAGGEILVNTYTTGDQTVPDIALDSDGGFVIVWQSSEDDDGDGSGTSVRARRFDSGGSPLGGPFLVNTYTPNDQLAPSIAMAETGEFIVVWSDSSGGNGDPDGQSIQGQRFMSDGAPIGAQFLVNTYTTSDQNYPAIAVDGASNFVVVWRSSGSDSGDTEYGSIQGQRFASDATPLGAQFIVNTYTTDDQSEPKVAMSADGDFAVVWTSLGSPGNDTGDRSIQGRRFAAFGDSIGDQFQVNTLTTGSQLSADVAMSPAGRFVVAWHDGSTGDIGAKIFASDGQPAGAQFQANTYTPGSQLGPTLAIDEAGDFVVLWSSTEADNGDDDESVQAQRFTSGGDPVGDPLLVNSFTTGSQLLPAVAIEPQGDFVAAWTQHEILGFSHGGGLPGDIRAQRFRVTASLGDRVFLDADFDGLQGPADPGLPDIYVHLFEENGDLVASTQSDDQGNFLFQPKIALAGVADRFYLEFEPTLRYSFTSPDVGADDTIDSDADVVFGQTDTFEVASAGSDNFDIDAGLANGIGNRVWHDADGDGIQTGGEQGIDGVTVQLYDGLDALRGSAVTASGGFYSFADLDAGTYYLSFQLPDGYIFTLPEQGDEASDSDVSPLTGTTQLFFLSAGEIRTDVDAGLRLILFVDGFESGDTSNW